MARIDDLIRRVGDERLRRDLEGSVKDLRAGLNFGLVFEAHEPEVLATPGVPIRVGSLSLDADDRVVEVLSVKDSTATVRYAETMSRGGGGLNSTRARL